MNNFISTFISLLTCIHTFTYIQCSVEDVKQKWEAMKTFKRPMKEEMSESANFILKYNFDMAGCSAHKEHLGRRLGEGGPHKSVRDEKIMPQAHTAMNKILKAETAHEPGRTSKNVDVFTAKPSKTSRASKTIDESDSVVFNFLPSLKLESISLVGRTARALLDSNKEVDPNNDLTKQMVAELKSLPCVEEAVYQPKARAFHIDPKDVNEFLGECKYKYPNDPNLDQQWWYMSKLDLLHYYPGIGHTMETPNIQDVHNGIWNGNGTGYKVGVIDTGLDFWHPETYDRNTLEIMYYYKEAEGGAPFETFAWFNQCTNQLDDDGDGFVDDCFGVNIEYQWWPSSEIPFPVDFDAHGTHVGGTISAFTNNNKLVASVCPDCKVVPISPMYIFEALEYALRNDIKILNMSFGYQRQYVSDAFRQIIISAFEEYHDATDGVIVVAAGNDPQDIDECYSQNPEHTYICTHNQFYFGFPCSTSNELDYVVCVGASDYFGKTTTFSSFGKNSVQVFAPGDDILSIVPTYLNFATGLILPFRGTSMASPIVAGIAALIRSKFPILTSSQVRKILVASCKKNMNLKEKCNCGGVVDALRALAHAALCVDRPSRCGFPDEEVDECDHDHLLTWFCRKASLFGHGVFGFCAA